LIQNGDWCGIILALNRNIAVVGVKQTWAYTFTVPSTARRAGLRHLARAAKRWSLF